VDAECRRGRGCRVLARTSRLEDESKIDNRVRLQVRVISGHGDLDRVLREVESPATLTTRGEHPGAYLAPGRLRPRVVFSRTCRTPPRQPLRLRPASGREHDPGEGG